MPACKSCGAGVVWAATAASGRLMPIDATPVADGNIDLIWTGDASGVLTAHVVSLDQPTLYGGPRYVSHFATCPHAAQHRSR